MNILDSKANILVVGTNGQGIMGGGLARLFKETFPGLKTAYASACRRGEQLPGHLFFWQAHTGDVICCLPVRERWEQDASLGDVLAGLFTLAHLQQQYDLHLCIPPLGCGKGGLDWNRDIKPFIVEHFRMDRTELCWED